MDDDYEKLQHQADGAAEEDIWPEDDDVMFGPEELVYKRDEDADVHSGGFSVRSILLKNKIPPIITYNLRQAQAGGSSLQQVSDLFADLVVPNWAYQTGGQRKTELGAPKVVRNKRFQEHGSDSEPEGDAEVLDEKLHQKLLDLVRQKAEEQQRGKTKITRKSRKQQRGKVGGSANKSRKRNVLE